MQSTNEVGQVRGLQRCTAQEDAPLQSKFDGSNLADGFACRPAYRATKRAFDIVFSATTMIVLMPVFLFIAPVIWLDDPHASPLFFQERVGLRGKTFRVIKFRSMYADAEERRADLVVRNEKDGPVFKIADDPRITRVGRFIRRTSLDELPQFWNVLKGDMSVVGPRPPLPIEVEHYSQRDRLRLCVKPGITCYWQIKSNRDSISFDEWVDLDLLYIHQASLRTDVGIIARTVVCVLTMQGR